MKSAFWSNIAIHITKMVIKGNEEKTKMDDDTTPPAD